MRQARFTLRPFLPAALPADVVITGDAERHGDILSLRYELRGPLPMLSIPAAAARPLRCDRLWEDTCFELFLGRTDSGRYWEFNLSPSGHWNVYSFTSYREGMGEERAFEMLPFSVEIGAESMVVSLDADLSPLVGKDGKAKAGMAAVVRSAGGGYTYWAVIHPGRKPDFHLEEGFFLEI